MRLGSIWFVALAIGLFMHVALALAYMIRFEGLSNYDLGGAFASNMIIDINPDMGQGMAGGEEHIVQGDDGVSAEDNNAQKSTVKGNQGKGNKAAGTGAKG